MCAYFAADISLISLLLTRFLFTLMIDFPSPNLLGFFLSFYSILTHLAPA